MIFRSSNIARLVAAFVLSCTFISPLWVHAQDSSVSLTVTPVIYRNSAEPGQAWSSSVRVVNSNEFNLLVYPQVVNFKPRGEGGHGSFVPMSETAERSGSTAAEWFTISNEPQLIPQGGSIEVPFSINVPADAPPGSQAAAILISTQPPEGSGRTAVQTAQTVSSLYFIRVAGDVIESARIREFRTTEQLLGRPEATFALRFENLGNVDVKPVGQIEITNMWGQERGIIPINREGSFGYTPRESIRRYQYSWSGEWSIADIGRYTAVVSLAYGENARQFANSATTFWVVPIRPLLYVIGTIIAIFWLISYAIRLYVRRMLVLAGIDPNERGRKTARQQRAQGDLAVGSYVSVRAPVSAGVQDLRMRLYSATAISGKLRAVGEFVMAYRTFFLCAVAFILVLWLIVWFISAAGAPQRAYEVTIDNRDARVTISSEEIYYEQQYGALSKPVVATNTPAVAVVNQSGTVGAGARVRRTLEQSAFAVTTLTAEPEERNRNTVIIFDEPVEETALALSRMLGGALLSARDGATTGYREPIVILVGRDQITQE